MHFSMLYVIKLWKTLPQDVTNPNVFIKWIERSMEVRAIKDN